MSTVPRPGARHEIDRVLRRVPVCALLGPRQCGKSTLAREVASARGDATVFDLESAADREALANPALALSALRGLVVLDEVQRLPALFEALRPLTDRPGTPARFLLLGSASPELVRGVSESLAGRIGFVDLTGFRLDETGPDAWRTLWLRGGFPRSYLAPNDGESRRWRDDFIRTFLERDVPALGIRVAPETLRRFWTMVAHSHGQIWSGSDIARSLGVGDHAVRRYLDILAATYVVRALPPWFENVAKRQVRSPKAYVRDTGLLHALLGIGTIDDLMRHPRLGASWEGFALEQVLSAAERPEAYWWATHGGAELDLLVMHDGKRYGVEFKHADAPRMTKSLHVALADLRLDRAWIVRPEGRRYPVHEQVDVISLPDAMTALPFLDRVVDGG